MSEYTPCFGCGAPSLNLEGESHAYMLSSPGCWAMFCEIMNREFSDLRYWKGHQFTVDAYAVQHVGLKKDKRAVSSVHIHLAALYGIFEEGLTLNETPNLRAQFSQYYKGKNLLQWLAPPASFGQLTVYELWDNEDPDAHYEIAEKWARSTWEAWAHQHHRIAELIHRARK